MYEDITKRLESLGYTLVDSDMWLVGFITDKVTKSILSNCNVTAVPDGLTEVAVDMICGEFLLAKKDSGQLDPANIDLNAGVIKQTQSGDTSVTFAVDNVQTPEQRFDGVINYLMTHGLDQFTCYRRLKWT